MTMLDAPRAADRDLPARDLAAVLDAPPTEPTEEAGPDLGFHHGLHRRYEGKPQRNQLHSKFLDSGSKPC